MLLYSEQQRFQQKWILVVCLITPITFFFVSLLTLIRIWQSSSSSNYTAITFLICTLCVFISVLIPILIRKVGLDTEVSKKGLTFRFVPFHRREKVYLFENILCVEAVHYRPIRDYGGWGIRIGRNGKAYNVSGNMGVMVNLEDGKRFLIGSQKSELLAQIITSNLRLKCK